MLHQFITLHAPEIVARARAKVAARVIPVPTELELKNGVPLFLDQLADRMRRVESDDLAMTASAAAHGGELLALGYSVSQVIHGYGDICQVVMQLAEETHAAITVSEFGTLNRCLDEAIAKAVSEYERRRDASVTHEGVERLGVLAHEMRNRLSAAMLAFSLLQDGAVGVGGSTGEVLGRNLRALRDLINNSLAGVRIDAGLGQHTRVAVSELIRDAGEEAAIEAAASGFDLVVSPVAPGIEVGADRQLLAAAIGNLLQNAFKFSRRNGQVTLRAGSVGDRVFIEVQDECGGLPPGKSDDLFLPFERRSANRSGLGLGLAVSRRGIESMGGSLRVKDLPRRGCVFAIDLPRLAAA